MRNIRKYDVLKYTLLSMGFFFVLHGTIAKSSFEQANAYYKEKQYAAAVHSYMDIIKKGDKNPAVYFNLGNTFYQLKQFPKAILYYEKALKLDPGNDKIEHNLKLTRNKALTKIEESKDFFVVKFVRNFVGQYSAQAWSFVFLAFLWMSVASFIVYFNKAPGKGHFYFRFGMAWFVLTVVLFIIARNRFNEQTLYRHAIVLQDDAELKNEPVKNAKTRATIEAGNKVQLLDKDVNWYKVSLPNGKQGWIDEKAIVKI